MIAIALTLEAQERHHHHHCRAIPLDGACVAQAWLRHGELEGLLRCEVHLAATSMKRNQHAVNAMLNRLGGGARAEFLLNCCVYALIRVEWAVNVKLMLTNILLGAG